MLCGPLSAGPGISAAELLVQMSSFTGFYNIFNVFYNQGTILSFSLRTAGVRSLSAL